MHHGSRIGTMHFSHAREEAFILGHGQNVVVFPCLNCPCLLEAEQFDPLCPVCHGTGRFYPPGLAFGTVMLLTDESSKRTFLDPGTWIPGTMQASVLRGITIADRDKVQLIDVRDTVNDEVLLRGIDDEVRNTAGVILDVVATRTQVYRQGTDYMLTPPNVVSWLPGGQMPPVGEQYSVRYSFYPEFLVSPDSPRLRVEHSVVQASEVILMRLDKAGRDL
jgi:Domain of unknown function (DUF4815)